MANAFTYPQDGEYVEVTVKGRVIRSGDKGFSLTEHNYSSFVHPSHIVNVVHIQEPVVYGGVYRDAKGAIWECVSTTSVACMSRVGGAGMYNLKSLAEPYKLIWKP